jgi:acetyl-CoA C-acetyltransferase
MAKPECTPVLIGIGVASRREEDPEQALEPLDLMLEAVNAAGADCGNAVALRGTQYIGVPHGRWKYANPGGAVATAIGAEQARSVFASVGVLQQSLLGEACQLIANGEAHTTLVTGADCGYRLLRARIAGQRMVDSQQRDQPHVRLEPKEELFHPVESSLGLTMPVGLYAIMESALRARNGWTVEQHRDRLAELYAGFSAVAADNPHAWKRDRLDAVAIREPSRANPMQAFPYTRSLCSAFNIDQAAALLFCSQARARELGIDPERWIYPLASTESNHQVSVSGRADLTTCPGAGIAGRAALSAGAMAVEDIDLLELYSCFPLAVEVYAAELGIDLARQLTVTGGMSFAGGPWNNYVFQSTCRAVELMRAGHGNNAFISSVSGMLTKQGFGLWSREPAAQGFSWSDHSAEVAQVQRTVDVVESFSGTATMAGCTVMYARDKAPWIMALINTPSGQRALVTAQDAGLISALESEEWVGREVSVQDNVLIS